MEAGPVSARATKWTVSLSRHCRTCSNPRGALCVCSADSARTADCLHHHLVKEENCCGTSWKPVVGMPQAFLLDTCKQHGQLCQHVDINGRICSAFFLPDCLVVRSQIANEDVSSPGEGTDMDVIWGSVLSRGPPAASLTALPGMFCNEQYTVEQKRALVIFRYLLVFVAALESFAHGANDTANATGESCECALYQHIAAHAHVQDSILFA